MLPYDPKFHTGDITEMRTTFTSSDIALSMDDPNRKPKFGTTKYPWRSMAVGTSFHVDIKEANYKTISTSCYKWSKKLNKKFRAIDHKENGIEVARLPDPLAKEGFDFK